MTTQRVPCVHAYWPSIREDGAANLWKCGRCGHSIPWSVGDYAEAYVNGEWLLRHNSTHTALEQEGTR